MATRLADLDGRLAMYHALSKYDIENAAANLETFLFKAFAAKGLDVATSKPHVTAIVDAMVYCDRFIEEDKIQQTLVIAIQPLK